MSTKKKLKRGIPKNELASEGVIRNNKTSNQYEKRQTSGYQNKTNFRAISLESTDRNILI